MTSAVGLMVEFKAKSQEVDSAFRKIESESNKVIARNRQLANSFNAINHSVGDIGKSLLKWGAIGATAAAALGVGMFATLNRIAESIDTITTKARSLGIAGEALQRLGYAAAQSGFQLEDLTTAFRKVNMTIGMAVLHGGTYAQPFDDLKLSLESIQGLSVDKQFLAIVDALGKVTDGNKQAAIASQFFSRGYETVLNLARDNIQASLKEFDSLGVGIDESQRKAVKAFGDAQTKMGAIFAGFGQKVTAFVSPAFTKLIDFISDSIIEMGGMDAAARSFAGTIVGGLQGAVGVANKFLNALTETKKVLLFIQEIDLQRQLKVLNVNRPALPELNAGNPINPFSIQGKSYIESIAITQEFEKLSQAIESNHKAFSAATATIEMRKDFLSPLMKSMTVLESSIPKISDAFSVATLEVAKFGDMAGNSSKIKDMITANETAAVDTKIKTLLGESLQSRSGLPQLDDDGFNSAYKAAFEAFQRGASSNELQGRLAGLEARTRPVSGFDNSANKGAFEALKTYVGKLGDTKPQKMDITVSTTEGFNIKIATSSAITAAIRDKAVSMMATEAAGGG